MRSRKSRSSRWLAGEHLADQVVADSRVGAGEVLDEGARVGMVLQRHRRQAQRCRPALGAPPERREVLGRQHDAERVEQRAGLVQREVQIGRADLGQAAVEAQAAEPDRRVGARDDDEPQGRRREAHEPFEICVDGVDDLVEVVEHEDDRLRGAFERVGERGGHQAHAHGLARADRQRRDGVVARRLGQRRRTPRQKRRRSASSVSSESQATGPGGRSSAIHELSSALLPAPAGAATSVSGPCTPESSRSSSRGRATAALGSRGTENFVASSASDAIRLGMNPNIIACGAQRNVESFNRSVASDGSFVCVGALRATPCCAPETGVARSVRESPTPGDLCSPGGDTVRAVGDAIGQVLSLGVGVALSPIPIIAVVLMLGTPRARANGPGVRARLGDRPRRRRDARAGRAASGADASEGGEPATWVGVLELVLGCLLRPGGGQAVARAPARGREAALPKWMQAIDTFGPGKALGLAVLLSAINPKNLLLTVAAAAAIAQTGVDTGSQAVALAVFVVIGTLAGLPVAIYFVLGARAEHMLGG